MFRKCRGFTLIELLIVVAIIAILAAIAVPNFLEAQVRAKVTRGKNDMRALATALEAYKIDENKYPPDFQLYQGIFPPPPPNLSNTFAYACLGRLTTPVAYITALPKNVFAYKRGQAYDGDPQWYGYKSDKWRSIVATGVLANPLARNNALWVLMSVGPDQLGSGGEYAMFGEAYIANMARTTVAAFGNGPDIYDPTNGTMSAGDIVRVGP